MSLNADPQPVDIHNINIRYKHGLRRITMRVTSNGTIQVTAPHKTSAKTIERLIASNQGWIAKQRATLSTKKRMPEDGAYIFGNWLTTKIDHNDRLPVGCRIESNQLILNPLHATDSWNAESKRIFTRFIKSMAGSYIPPRLEYWSSKMDLTFTGVTLREQVSRWGSCSSSGSINLNWRLVHAPLPVIDYVLIHELAHRTHLNHSGRFWNLVQQFDPEFHSHRGWLKREGRWLIDVK